MALKEINIRNFAIIKQLEIEIDEGLTVITGETGAGKSIVLGALNLLLGSRAEANMVRHGEEQCEISALFDISQQDNARAWLAERDLNDISTDDASNDQDTPSYCLIRRIVRTDKPTKCYINDQPMTLASLKELGAMLVDLHGQHEHQSLLRRATQRQILDDFAGNQEQLDELATLASKIQRLQRELGSVTDTNSETSDRMDLLSFQINELDEAQLVEGEFAELVADQSRLANTETLSAGLEQVIDQLFLNDEQNLSSELGKHISKIQQLAEMDDSLAGVVEQLNEALSQVEDSKTTLETSLRHIEANPERLQELDQRMELLINLARKHRCDEDALPHRHQELHAEYDRLQGRLSAPEVLQAELAELSEAYHIAAHEISAQRQRVAEQLTSEITTQMQDLGMRGGQLSIQVEPQIADDIIVSESGIDHIEFLVSAGHGLPLQPLNKTASGGELSRISLAIQVITSAQAQTPSLVFDEVDVGVGGKMAVIVGERLKQLGQRAQVLCITHLPQVAAHGDHHFAVDKISSSYDTYSTLINLDSDQRVEEIARMLGGKEITEQTRVHAAEMLSQSHPELQAAS